MRAQLGFLRSEAGTPHSEPFDELSPSDFVPGYSRTIRKSTDSHQLTTYAHRNKLRKVPLEGESNDHRKRLAHSKQHRKDNESCVDRH